MPNRHHALTVAAVVLAGLVAHTAASHGQQLRVVDTRRISPDPRPFDMVESYLAVNPTDPSNLIAAAMAGSAEKSVVYVSRDGGSTWRLAGRGDSTAFPGGDPMVAFDGTGRAFFTTITPRFQVWRSDDGGRTWLGPSEVPGRSFDRQWVAASAAAGGEGHPFVYAASKTPQPEDVRLDDIAVTVSGDGGVSFPEPHLIRPDSGFLHVVTHLHVFRDGTAVLPYLVHYGGAPGGNALLRGRRWVLISDNGGRDWSGPHHVAETFDYGNANQDQAMKGLGGGVLAADETGGRYDGTLYQAWTMAMNDRLQIVVAHSRDGGRTWADPVRVNDGGYRSNHSTPALAVNRDGVLAVSWYDRRNDPTDACFQPFVAVSTDGGATFGVNTQVAEAPTCFRRGSRWANGGDTQGIVPLPNGSFRTAWISGARGSLALWTSLLTPSRPPPDAN
jgi:hypothetical protein